MADHFVSRGFLGKRKNADDASRLPPGQYLVKDFPVLSAGPTPRTKLEQWSLTIDGLVNTPVHWTWEQFLALPRQAYTVDISCVTKWTKLDMKWEGVSVDTLFERAESKAEAGYLTAYCDGGYTTNLALDDVLNGKAFVANTYDGKPVAPEHGGPARLVVPHLYFWKSAKWIRGFRLMDRDKLGFWESLGYHRRGDPWKEERYSGD